MTPDLDDTWQRIDDELRRGVPTDVYDLWLAPLRLVALEDGIATIEAPSGLRGGVASRFSDALAAAAGAAIGRPATVVVRDAVAGSGARERGQGARTRAAAAGGVAAERRFERQLNPKYAFDQFVIGDGNRLAHAAALAVAELPGQAYNPLFLYGPPGVGKTHLLHSIGNFIQRFGDGLEVRCTTVETFTNDFVAALGSGSIGAFKGRYRRADVLLVDDVQFLASKARTEEEFFHTFNDVFEAGSQLVITCDRVPSDLGALEDRLRERFASGLVAAIEAPDVQTRLAVLRKRAQHDALAIDDDVLQVLADRVSISVRVLEGALIRVVAFASLRSTAPTPQLAATVLDDLYPDSRAPIGARPTIDRVQEIAAETFGITLEELVSPSRTARLAWPRQVAMYLARRHTDATLPAIGASFGGRNHSTVVHACQRASDRLRDDPEARIVVQRLAAQLGPAVDKRSGRAD